MDHISENIINFESLLRDRSSKKPPVLYTSSEDQNKLIISSKTSKISAKEVLANVSRQVKALQNADTVRCKRVGNTLDKYKMREFMTVDMLPVDRVVHQKQPTKFETQCVSDTQLINVIENAEIVDNHRGVTQEFDETFCQNSDNDSDDKINDSSSKPRTKTDTGNDTTPEIINNDTNTILKINDEHNKFLDNSNVITCEMDTITCHQSAVITDLNDYVDESLKTRGFNKSVELFDVSEEDADRPVSPVLITNGKYTASPLVVDLYAFEKFENLANPIIEEHADMTIAKSMIHSQIIGKEILIPAHNYDNIGRDSPVLSKIDCITTNFNKDDVESICTCSNNCIDEDVKCTNEQATEDIILTSENKKTLSKVVKAEIKDEILFSSDEEYEYLHKSIQELPLTCALETSFYDTSDVLDKTMYVGFQTASNKSIQINTVSFTKAKSILSDIDNEEKGTTLSELVEIFDSGKAVSESVENVTRNVIRNKLDCDTDIQRSSKIEHSAKNFSEPSKKLNEFQEKIVDTLENVSLTTLEKGREANDEILISQIISCKSTLKSANLNDSIISDGKVNDTLDNVGLTVLQQNEEKDDDIMMSQVITFKSISRTPHLAVSVSHDSQLSKVMPKRKLEGFKTASNKKIKLSDNALARCKKVFQDIDLDDSEYLSTKSNFIETEEITHDDFKSHDFDIFYDASKANSEVNHTTKENYICGNVSNKMVSKDDYFESEAKEQPRNEDLVFQINDQIILQEFEDEMPLKETNNNACVGFKTASNKSIAISEVAMAATKQVFQDIITVAATNENTIKTTDVCIGDSGNFENIIKNAPAGVVKMATKNTKSSEDALTNIKSNIGDVGLRRKQADDHETHDIQKRDKFVGFKTASHKEIIISAQAREKFRDFYRDIDREPTQNVNKEGAMNSNIVKKSTSNVADEFNCGIDTQDFLAGELTHIEELFKDKIVGHKKSASPTFKGFQTASRKAIVISEKALEKSKKLFEDITNKECDIKCHPIKDNEQDHEHGNKIKTQPSKDTKKNESFDGESQFTVLNNMTNKTPYFTGYQTSSTKNVCVSKQEIEATKTLFQDNVLSDQQNIEQVDNLQTSLEHNAFIFHDIKMSGTIQNEFLRESHALSEFQNVNSEADMKTMNSEAPIFAAFKTASAKPICISAAAMEKTKRVFSEVEVKDDDLFGHDYGAPSNLKYSASRFLGFQTASKKKINISAKALAKSKQLLSDLELKDNNNDIEDYDKKITEDSVSNLKDESVSFKESNTENEPCKPSTSKFIGFQTASNKAVNISKEALARSKQLFQDFDIYDKESDTLNEKITSSEENKNLSHDVGNCNLSENGKVFQGFQTASNKTVIISVKALEKSKKLFEDLNLSQLNKEPNTTVDSNGIYGNKATVNDIINYMKDTKYENNFKGFQTASNKSVKVSEQALENTKDIFKDVRIEKGDNILGFKGFQTASNKQVKISEKALAMSKKLFEDIHLSQFNTNSKTTVETEIINDIKDPIVSVPENKFTGFQTASNKKVIVTEQALAKTKDVFKDIHIENDDPILTNETAPIFKGFQTASNKKVSISEKALAKSKKLFEDINLSQIEQEPTKKADLHKLQCTKADDAANKMKKPVDVQEYKQFGGFQTASNRGVKTSEQALAKTKDIFKDMHVENENDILLKHGEMKTSDLNVNVDVINSKYNKFSSIGSKLDINRDIIDTQVLNDFESPLNTEDFCKSTPVSKRSGSPILSCPRAKKRKFETPYRTSKKVEPRNVFVPPKLAKTYNYNEDYKKHKKYTLKDIAKLEKERTKVDVDPYLSEFDFDSLLYFVFTSKRNDYTDGKMAIEDIKKIFLDSVNKKIVPEGWLDNHLKLIIWKLISYELKFPNVMNNTCTIRNVLEQLKYRYEKELYHVKRPILRKILEKDEVPSKTMVLCVAAIYVDNVSVTSVPPSSQNVDLLVTDGWYCVKACLDRMLIRLVLNGSIVVGRKIAVCGAELINCEQGVAPWEDTSSVRLKLHGNSTRRARWLARLGPRTDLIPCGLRTARADGGKAAVLRLALTRVYPPMTVERMDDGSTVTLSERLENIRQMKYESERQIIMEKLYEEVEKEMSDLDSQDSEGCSNEKGCIDSGSQIDKCMKRSKDPDEYRSHLTKSQSRMLEDHNSRQREKLVERVRERFQEKLDKYGLKTDRNVVQLLKVRVADFTEKAGSLEVTKGYLSIWRPSAAVLELVTEGAWIEILNVVPTGIRNSEIQLSTGRQTVFNQYKQKNEKYKLYANTLQRKCYEIKEITQNPSMTTDYNEIDTVGMIFCIEPSTKDFHEQSFQNVYLADADKNIICVNFWGGLTKFGYENVLDTGQIITCVNLQKRAGNTRKSIPQYRVTELSYFTKTPKSKMAMEITNEMSKKLLKIKDKFCEDCIILKNNYSIFKTRNNENVTPYRFGYNIPRDISPRNCDVNLNLTGLDFESSFDTQEISPQALLRKKKVNEKIEKIRLNYGEPPPLSSIHIINKSKNASATYKSPLISNLERSVSPLKSASPVSVNKTFVKNVNPVKLNFSSELNESVDHFAEDFDASPPLSLDSDTVYK